MEKWYKILWIHQAYTFVCLDCLKKKKQKKNGLDII